MKWAVPAAIVLIAGALIALLVITQRGGGPGAEATPGGSGSGAPEISERTEGPDYREAERRSEDDLLSYGPADAPVGLIVFSDYQCPFCARWNHDTLPQMKQLADDGALRIEWRDVNVFGPASERASRASVAAAQQGKFWEYHGELFEGGEKRSEAELSDEALVALAGELGLDTERFAADMDSEETTTEVQRNMELGMSLGAASTPVFLLGGEPISGAQPTEVFTAAFERALERAQQEQGKQSKQSGQG